MKRKITILIASILSLFNVCTNKENTEKSNLSVQKEEAKEKEPYIINEAKNKIEEKVLAYQRRDMDGKEFIKLFLESNFYVIGTKDQFVIEDGVARLAKNPKLFSLHFPEYSVLCLYTHNSRINPTLEKFPEYKYAANIKIGEFIKNSNINTGIAINPFWDKNVEFSPEHVNLMREMLGE